MKTVARLYLDGSIMYVWDYASTFSAKQALKALRKRYKKRRFRLELTKN